MGGQSIQLKLKIFCIWSSAAEVKTSNIQPKVWSKYLNVLEKRYIDFNYITLYEHYNFGTAAVSNQ